jgi:hypothetical protein
MATKKTAKAKKPATVKKKTAAKKRTPTKKATAPKAAAPSELPSNQDLDRKSLVVKARQLKLELLAIRFNLQAPSLKDYRKKRRELAGVLAQLG